MCKKCGCNTCDSIRGPLLTEGKIQVKSLLSENLQYHLDKNIPLFESVFRIGSNAHLKLIKEARKMYSRNVIDLCEDDEELIKTHLGEFAVYEGESVPLDLPMLNESKYDTEETIQQTIDRLKARIKDPNDGGNVPFLVQKIKDLEKSLNESYDYDEVAQSEFGMDYDQLGPGEKEWVRDEIDNMLNEFSLPKFDIVKPIINKFLGGVEKAGKKLFNIVKREGKQTIALVKEIAEYVIKGEKPNAAEQKKINKQLLDIGFLALLGVTGNIPVSAFGILYWVLQESGVAKEFLKLDESYDRGEMLDLVSHRLFDKDYKKLNNKEKDEAEKEAKIHNLIKEALRSQLDEKKKAKKKKKKDPPIGKPKRGGSKAYYVYVRDPKTKKIKKVSFGSGGLRAKIRNPKARNAFAKRHRCKEKTDRTKPGYWSCRLPRYASQLGLGANMNTFW